MRGRCTGPVSGHAPRQVVNERPPDQTGYPAARSPQGQPMAMHGLRGLERHAARVEKQKGPEPCGVRASVKRAWEVCAPMRSLHPVAPDPRMRQPTSLLAGRAWGSGADGTSAACRGHRKTWHARTPGPMRVECWRGSVRFSRWFLVVSMRLKSVQPKLRMERTVNSLYSCVNRADNLFLSRCCF